MNTFDIFDLINAFNDSLRAVNEKNENTIESHFDNVDFTKVTKEELDNIMKTLDSIKSDSFFSIILGDKFIDDLKAEVQAKWDMANAPVDDEPFDDDEPEEETTTDVLPDSVKERLEGLVQEYLDTVLVNKKNDPVIDVLKPIAGKSYFDFAKFIYLHK